MFGSHCLTENPRPFIEPRPARLDPSRQSGSSPIAAQRLMRLPAPSSVGNPWDEARQSRTPISAR